MKCTLGMKASFSKTISESDVYLFAGITGDLNSLHINKVAAEEGNFGKRIVHGALLNGLISGVIGMKLPGGGTIYMEQDTCFMKPVYIGDTVTAKVEIEKLINEEKGIVRLHTSIVNQHDDMVCDGYAVVKVPR